MFLNHVADQRLRKKDGPRRADVARSLDRRHFFLLSSCELFVFLQLEVCKRNGSCSSVFQVTTF